MSADPMLTDNFVAKLLARTYLAAPPPTPCLYLLQLTAAEAQLAVHPVEVQSPTSRVLTVAA